MENNEQNTISCPVCQSSTKVDQVNQFVGVMIGFGEPAGSMVVINPGLAGGARQARKLMKPKSTVGLAADAFSVALVRAVTEPDMAMISTAIHLGPSETEGQRKDRAERIAAIRALIENPDALVAAHRSMAQEPASEQEE